jgi:hypothetical protein
MAQPSQLKRLRIRRGKAQPSQLARLRMSALARLPGR